MSNLKDRILVHYKESVSQDDFEYYYGVKCLKRQKMTEFFKLFAWSTEPFEETNKGVKSRCEHYVRLKQDKRAAGVLCVHFMYEESLAILEQYVEKHLSAEGDHN